MTDGPDRGAGKGLSENVTNRANTPLAEVEIEELQGRETFPRGSLEGGQSFLAKGPTVDAESEGIHPASASRVRGEKRDSLLQSGEHLGRLELGDVLGEGAFGTVFAAYDPQLRRKLAIKVLRPGLFESDQGQQAHKRLIREARALARVAHPNVVAVYDIGTIGEQTYVAMQYVEGENLGEWLHREERSWRQILSAYTQAGEGLQAVHDEGLVHRDFKPENVLVNEQGKVRVADFGLVGVESERQRRAPAALSASEAEEQVVPRLSSDNLRITRMGAVMGTGLYMAPEQHMGEETTARSDQFSFCVSLFISLTGKRPFAGDSYSEVREAVLSGALQEPPLTRNVPRWVLRPLLRGMERDPKKRYASMNELLKALRADPARKRTRILWVAGLVLTTGVLSGALAWSQANSRPECLAATSRLEGVWDDTTKTKSVEIFSRASRERSYELMSGRFDKFRSEWISVRQDVCLATHERSEQSDDLLDRRMMCLDRQLSYVASVTSFMLADDRAKSTATESESVDFGTRLDRAVRASVALPHPADCTAEAVMQEGKAEGGDLIARQALLKELERAQALSDLGELDEALEVIDALPEKRGGDDYVLAKKKLLEGKILVDKGDFEKGETHLSEALTHATKSGQDIGVARTYFALLHLDGTLRDRYESAHQQAELARLALLRGAADDFQMATLKRALATVLSREGKHSESMKLLEEARPLYEKNASPTELSDLYLSMGNAHVADGANDKAIDYFGLAQSHLGEVLGADHPDHVFILNNLSVALKNVGRIDEAAKTMERSIEITKKSFGPSHYNLVTIYNNLGNIHRRRGDFDEAERVLEASIELGKETLEEGHPTVTDAMMNLGIVSVSRENYQRATTLFQEVLERNLASFDGDHPKVASSHNNIGEALYLSGKHEEALGPATRGLEMKQRIYGKNHPRVVGSMVSLGSILTALERYDEAIETLSEGLRIYVEAVGLEHPLSLEAMRKLLGALGLAGRTRECSAFLEEQKKKVDDSEVLAKIETAVLRCKSQAGRRKIAAEGARALLDRLPQESPLREELEALMTLVE